MTAQNKEREEAISCARIEVEAAPRRVGWFAYARMCRVFLAEVERNEKLAECLEMMLGESEIEQNEIKQLRHDVLDKMKERDEAKAEVERLKGTKLL